MKKFYAAILVLFSTTAYAAPPYATSDVQAIDAAVRRACPQIDGVSTSGEIFFQAGAACQAAAQTTMQNFIPIPSTVQINSTGTPAVNGVYAFDAATTTKVMAVSLYIQVNNKFPAGYTTLPYPDASGAMHNFPSTVLFQKFATALADYTTAITLGQLPPTPVIIP